MEAGFDAFTAFACTWFVRELSRSHCCYKGMPLIVLLYRQSAPVFDGNKAA
jgi:hypothetical protein